MANNFDLKKYLKEGKLHENEMDSSFILPPNQIKRYARMKTVANVTDPEVLSKIMMAFQSLSKNQDMSYQEMVDQFGEEAALRTFQILRSAYIDGYADKFQNLQSRLNQETDEFYADGIKFKTLDENEMSSDIVPFLQSNKEELLQTLASKFNWDEDDMEEYSGMDIGMADEGVAGLGEGGLDFSFDESKVADEFGDASTFEIEVAGKPVYGISYNF
jgi:hypothetical protein